MVVCPLCEHPQDFGIECEVCGKNLGGLDDLGPPPVAEAKVEGLEATVSERLGEVPVERVGELEVTQFDEVQVAVDQTPDVEPSMLADVGEVSLEPVIDLERGREVGDGQKTAAPVGAVKCRYCGNVQATGLLCDRCGMRLPRMSEQQLKVAAKKGEEVSVRCSSCGAPGRGGERCSECGKQLPTPEA